MPTWSIWLHIGHKYEMVMCPDSVKLTGLWSMPNEKVGGPVKNMGGPIKLLCVIMFEILKSYQECNFGPVKPEKFSQCVSNTIFRSKGQRSRSHRSFEVRSVDSCLFDGLNWYVAQIQPMRWRMCIISWLKVKGQGHTGLSKFLVCPLHISRPIWLIGIICGTNTTHEVAMCHVPFSACSGQKAKGQGHMGRLKFLLCLLCDYVRISLVDFISGTNAAPWGGNVWHCAPYSSKKSKVKVARVVQGVCRDRFVTLCLFDRLVSLSFGTNTIHEVTMCQAPFPGQKGKGLWVIWSICYVLSVAPYLSYWFMWYVAQILYSLRGQCVPCTPLPMEVPWEKVKFKITWVVCNFCCVCSLVPCLFD